MPDMVSSMRRLPMAASAGMHSAKRFPRKATESTAIEIQSACVCRVDKNVAG